MSLRFSTLVATDTAFLNSAFLFRPAIQGFNRLEGYPRDEDFSRSLRAEIRDPLWLLTRQWQLGELEGDDAGSPIDARIKLNTTKLQTYMPKSTRRSAFPADLPLETVVERENVPHDLATIRYICDLMKSALAEKGLSASQQKSAFEFHVDTYQLAGSAVDGFMDRQSKAQLALGEAHLFDTKDWFKNIANGQYAQALNASNLDQALVTEVLKVAQVVMEIFDDSFSVPDKDVPSAWESDQLEYAFECETAKGQRGDKLSAQNYSRGSLDWSAFDFVAPNRGSQSPQTDTEIASYVPAAVSYAGMPSPRFWEMEDSHVEFTNIRAGTTDLAKLLLMEFALTFSNDWLMIPIEVEVGSLCEIEGIVVRNTFDENIFIKPTGRGKDDDWQRWSMFNLSTHKTLADNRLFLPPVTPKVMQAPPLEKVIFIRDEMANMCWAVEDRVPAASGKGIDYSEIPQTDVVAAQPARRELQGNAQLSYTLGNEPPANWFPFLPVQISGSNRNVKLQRGRLPFANRPIHGEIIRVNTPYYIREEEIPRAGKSATRSFQRCRWHDGKVVTWLGRRVKTGRGEGASGLEFDTLNAG